MAAPALEAVKTNTPTAAEIRTGVPSAAASEEKKLADKIQELTKVGFTIGTPEITNAATSILAKQKSTSTAKQDAINAQVAKLVAAGMDANSAETTNTAVKLLVKQGVIVTDLDTTFTPAAAVAPTYTPAVKAAHAPSYDMSALLDATKKLAEDLDRNPKKYAQQKQEVLDMVPADFESRSAIASQKNPTTGRLVIIEPLYTQSNEKCSNSKEVVNKFDVRVEMYSKIFGREYVDAVQRLMISHDRKERGALFESRVAQELKALPEVGPGMSKQDWLSQTWDALASTAQRGVVVYPAPGFIRFEWNGSKEHHGFQQVQYPPLKIAATTESTITQNFPLRMLDPRNDDVRGNNNNRSNNRPRSGRLIDFNLGGGNNR